jgi:hypothetical protein
MAKMMNKGKGKPGPNSVDKASKGSDPSGNSPGNPGKSMPAKAIPGPASTGGPMSLKKALKRK